jgi:hypothetical protein
MVKSLRATLPRLRCFLGVPTGKLTYRISASDQDAQSDPIVRCALWEIRPGIDPIRACMSGIAVPLPWSGRADEAIEWTPFAAVHESAFDPKRTLTVVVALTPERRAQQFFDPHQTLE